MATVGTGPIGLQTRVPPPQLGVPLPFLPQALRAVPLVVRRVVRLSTALAPGLVAVAPAVKLR
jgi:hypothetical protein